MSRRLDWGRQQLTLSQSLARLRQQKAQQAEEQRLEELRKQSELQKQKRQEEQSAERRRKMREVINKANQLNSAISLDNPRRRQKDPEHQALEKQFGQFAFLDFPTLKKIQTLVDKYSQEEKKDRHGLELLRFLNRKELVRIFLITVGELQHKHLNPINPIETVLLNPNVKPIDIIVPMAHLLQNLLFNTLFKQGLKSRVQPYQMKIKILKDNLNDKDNFQLRRAIVNKTKSPQFVLQASEQQFKSESRKKEQKYMVERYAREADTWEDDYQKRIKKEKEKEEQTHQHIPHYYPHIQYPIRELTISKKTPEEQAYQKNVKEVYDVYCRCKKEMKQRVFKLRGGVGKRLRQDWETTVQQK